MKGGEERFFSFQPKLEELIRTEGRRKEREKAKRNTEAERDVYLLKEEKRDSLSLIKGATCISTVRS